MVTKQFYAELGKLFYAIAAIDNWVNEKEKNKILEIVKKELVPKELHKDRAGTDLAFFTEIEFDYLNATVANPISALESFIDFVVDHKTALNANYLRVCVRMVKEISKAYRGINEKEQVLIEKLQTVYNQHFYNYEKQHK